MSDRGALDTLGMPHDGATCLGEKKRSDSDEPNVHVIRPPAGWQGFNFSEVWRYRELLWVLAERDIKVRYKQTVLGAAWAIIQPVMMMIVFTVLFGRLANVPSDGVPYPIFVYAGLLPWYFFANTIATSANAVVGSSSLVSKVYFPRLIIPLSAAGSTLVDLAIAMLVLVALMVWYGVGWSTNLLVAPVLVVGAVFIALGVGVFMSALTVTYRDFRYVVPFLVQFWMFATPVVYPASLVPEQWHWCLYLNPMTGLVEGFRSAFLDRPFDWPAIALSLVVAGLIFFVGIAYFSRVERRFADVI